MMVKDFKKTRAARTAARKAGHKARVETKWAKHEPPAIIFGSLRTGSMKPANGVLLAQDKLGVDWKQKG